MSTKHNCKEDIEKSNAESNNPIFDSLYKQIFNTTDIQMRYMGKEDLKWQLLGVDRAVKVNDRIYKVEEKVRYQDFDDILLETHTVNDSGYESEGWIYKSQNVTDNFLYVNLPGGKAYWIEWKDLFIAFKKYGNKWLSQYRRIAAHNLTHTTYSVCVPVNVLMNAVHIEVVRFVDPESDPSTLLKKHDMKMQHIICS